MCNNACSTCYSVCNTCIFARMHVRSLPLPAACVPPTCQLCIECAIRISVCMKGHLLRIFSVPHSCRKWSGLPCFPDNQHSATHSATLVTIKLCNTIIYRVQSSCQGTYCRRAAGTSAILPWQRVIFDVHGK